LKIAHEAIKVQCQAQKELEAKVGKTAKREYNHETHDEELRAAVRAAIATIRVYEAV
jgi:polyribonucleotide nucleotidyltransferase